MCLFKVIETDDNFGPLTDGYDYLVDFLDLSFPTKRPDREHAYIEVRHCKATTTTRHMYGKILKDLQHLVVCIERSELLQKTEHRKPRSYNECNEMLDIFFQSVMASATLCAVVCCGGGAASVPEILEESINSFTRQELSLVKTWRHQ